ncbi:MAG: PEP-CTERM sorting domain-containing protein [Sedimentisphaerales bacterium]
MKKLLLVCLLAVFPSFVLADTIDISYVAVDAGGEEWLTLGTTAMNGANGVQAMHTQNPVGPLASLITPNAWIYCYELGAYTDFPFNTYNVSTLASVMAPDKAALISQLWAQHYNSAWQSSTPIYIGGNYGDFVSGQPADTVENQQALAMDFAIYEISYDFDGTMASLDLANGTFKGVSSNPSVAMSTAISWLSSLVLPANYTGPQAQLLGLTHSGLQDLIVEVPEPATMALLSLGGLLLRRKKQ